MNIHAEWDSKLNAEILLYDAKQLITEYDDTFMPTPDIEFEPDLLISKVRKHYMEYMIKLLSANYETNQRLVNKNIYLPSAIWRCAKKLEMVAAQSCMVIQIYRKCITTMINEVKTDTKSGRLYKKLYESLHKEPQDEKKTQTTVTGDNWQCYCTDKKRRRKRSSPPKIPTKAAETNTIGFTQRIEELSVLLQDNKTNNIIHKIPVVTNMQTDTQEKIISPVVENQPLPENQMMNHLPLITPNNTQQSDDLMLQLEKIFESDHDEDELFTSTIYEDNNKIGQNAAPNSTQDPIIGTLIENHAAQIKSLDERVATLTGLLTNTETPPPSVQPQQKVVQKKQKNISKWLCEEYFLKKSLFELLYEIGDNNRHKLARIKDIYRQLFGEDSDDEEGIMSPDESPDFIASCKARIDSWVMSILAPYYTKGHINGKMLYKAVARHLIELIYKCKQYPSRHEVTSFVLDFLESRGKIDCEADYKEFRINNFRVPTYSIL